MHWARNLYKFARQPYAIWLRHGFWKVLKPVGLTMDVVFELINHELLITDYAFDKIPD
jgi:hypothetical protein